LPYAFGKNSVLTRKTLYIFIPDIPSKVKPNLKGINPTVPPDTSFPSEFFAINHL
jgi:hypothetical protein